MLSHFFRKLGAIAGGRPANVVRADGLNWQLAPNAIELLGADGPHPTRWQAAGRAELIKQNLQRTIWRVRLPGGTVYVKRCRANTPRSWCREVLRPAKARLEYENAVSLRELGIPAVEPVACGTTPGPLPGDSVLITRDQPRVVPFHDFLEHTLPALPPADRLPVRRQIARTLAAFLARMHDLGVSHPDPHPGNLLVELPPSRVLHYTLTDLHAVRFGKPLTWAETRANLVLMNRWFQERASRSDRARFWRAYLAARVTLPVDQAKAWARRLEADTLASNHRFWKHRTDRYRANNREYRRVRADGVKGHAVREVPEEVLRAWLADPDAPFAHPAATRLKDSRSSTVAVVPTGWADAPVVVWKRFNLKGRWRAGKNLFRASPALRSWLLGHGLRDRGLPTARPLVLLHRYRLGVPTVGYVAFEFVPGAVGLPEAVAGSGANPNTRRAWAGKLGRLAREMHDKQVSHRDLKAPNVLLAGADADPISAEPVLIDLVGVLAGRPVSRRQRVRDLARLNSSFLNSATVSRADRLRFLRAYLRWGLHGRGDWKAWWAEIGRATAAKAAWNRRRGRPLG